MLQYDMCILLMVRLELQYFLKFIDTDKYTVL